MKLLIDFGNTRLKWALLEHGRLRQGGVFAHADRSLEAALHLEWPELARIDTVLVASVVDAAREAELAALVQARFHMRAEFLRSPAQALGIRNAYAEPAWLGIDRFLGLAALHAAHAQPQVLASAGTALTLDALAADGSHLGGIIVPGLALMRSALLARTARTHQPGGSFHEMPASTADGVFSGAVYAAAGAVESFRAMAAQRLGATPALFLTGGAADELTPLLAGVGRRHDLVLRGLALWAETAQQAG